MLKNRLLSGVAAIAMFAAASGATPAAAREAFDWTGVYIGGHVGGGVADYDGGKNLVEASPIFAAVGDATEAISGDVDLLESVRARLGVMYERGYGDPQDYDEAVKWDRLVQSDSFGGMLGGSESSALIPMGMGNTFFDDDKELVLDKKKKKLVLGCISVGKKADASSVKKLVDKFADAMPKKDLVKIRLRTIFVQIVGTKEIGFVARFDRSMLQLDRSYLAVDPKCGELMFIIGHEIHHMKSGHANTGVKPSIQRSREFESDVEGARMALNAAPQARPEIYRGIYSYFRRAMKMEQSAIAKGKKYRANAPHPKAEKRLEHLEKNLKGLKDYRK